MNGLELIKGWPQLGKLSAKEILLHPAWQLQLEFDGKMAVVEPVAAPAEKELLLAVTLDDNPHVLGISKSAAFADLSLVWDNIAALPKELVLALVEKECGAFLQFLENVVKMELRLKGLHEAEARGERNHFRFACGSSEIGFSLNLPGEVVDQLGRFENLSASHPSIREMRREVYTEYAQMENVPAFQAGDCLVPPAGFATAGKWQLKILSDAATRIIAAEPTEVSFAQLADDAMPSPPVANSVIVCQMGRLCARGTVSRLGDAVCIKIENPT